MPKILPINVEDLLRARGVESARLEFKASWNPGQTGLQVLHTICAFANDLQNLNGGYIIIGVSESEGSAVLPPTGLEAEQIEAIQKWIRGKCNTLDPPFQPVMSPEVVNDRDILVIWAPGSDTRPHQAPKVLQRGAPRRYYVRLGSETVQARGEIQRLLLSLTAKVPFDDRRAVGVALEKLRIERVREFLSDIHSSLLEESEAREIYRRMFISTQVNDHEVPRHVGLLFFSDNPEEWFRGARIEVVQFAADSSGNVIEEKVFRGPLQHQLRDGISYLRSFSTQHLEKLGDRPEVKGWVSFPLAAMEEALVNAVYHRSYEGEPEPTKVYLYPDRIEIISYPGPVPGIERQHLQPEGKVPPVPARNRRIGEFLKELRLAEGRGTGIPKVYRAMEQNGSPAPSFSFDESRTYFQVTLPAHPEYVAIVALRDAAHLRAIGDQEGALSRLQQGFREQNRSETLASTLITELARSRSVDEAREVFDAYFADPDNRGGARVVTAMSTALLDAGFQKEAQKVLNRMPPVLDQSEAVDAAILARRLGRQQSAHRFFERSGEAAFQDVRALHEFAQTKINLAPRPSRDPYQRDARRRLLNEAQEMLKRVLQMDAPPTRHAWAWYDLARVLRWLRAPEGEIRHALEQARQFAPADSPLARRLQQFSASNPGTHSRRKRRN